MVGRFRPQMVKRQNLCYIHGWVSTINRVIKNRVAKWPIQRY